MIVTVPACSPPGSIVASQAKRCASPSRNASNTWSSCSSSEYSAEPIAAISLSRNSATACCVSARTSPSRLPKWCRINGCEMPAAAAISCSRSPSGPARAISCCAVSRISCRASSGVRRARFTEACIGPHKSLLTLLSVYPKLIGPCPERGTPAMSQAADTRRHPIAAYRAVRKLMRNREDTRQVFLLIDALRGKSTLRQFARFRETEIGRAALADRRRLFDRLEDQPTLAALPAGTLGRAYHDF